jgi:hypothetical protein
VSIGHHASAAFKLRQGAVNAQRPRAARPKCSEEHYDAEHRSILDDVIACHSNALKRKTNRFGRP